VGNPLTQKLKWAISNETDVEPHFLPPKIRISAFAVEIYTNHLFNPNIRIMWMRWNDSYVEEKKEKEMFVPSALM
jgi:hypothetical protein